MVKGLCRRCGEKWHKGHKCAESVHLNVLQEVWELLEPDTSEDKITSAMEEFSDQCFMALSESAISGSEAPRTLKIRGSIQSVEVLILLDSRSSHSFLSAQVASIVSGVTPRTTTTVRVANGNVLQSDSELLYAEWCMQGYLFKSDLKVTPLQNFDLIIGMDWLENHSPM
jgi:hypothetical protein